MKRRVIFVFLLVVLCLGLIGCNESEKVNVYKTDNRDIYVWTDDETGVQYIVYCHTGGYSGMGGITPRLNADGSLYVESED